MWVPGIYIVHLQVLQEDLQSLLVEINHSRVCDQKKYWQTYLMNLDVWIIDIVNNIIYACIVYKVGPHRYKWRSYGVPIQMAENK